MYLDSSDVLDPQAETILVALIPQRHKLRV